MGVTTVSNSLILGGWVTKVLKNGNKNMRVEGWVTTHRQKSSNEILPGVDLQILLLIE